MTEVWDGALRNNASDIFVDTVLSVAIVVAYVPQINRVFRLESCRGLSPYFVLFHGLFSNAQLAQTLLYSAFTYTNDREPVLEIIGDGRLKGTAALGGVFGLIQVAIQWTCAITLVTVYTKDYTASDGSFLKRAGIAASVFVHAAIFLFPTIAIALPKPSPHEMGRDIFIGLCGILNHWLVPLFLLLQFYAQFLELRRCAGRPGALSLLFLGLELLVSTSMALRWFLRLRAPAWGNVPAPLSLWYQWGELPINLILHAIGCLALIIFYAAGLYSSDADGSVSERVPLLG